MKSILDIKDSFLTPMNLLRVSKKVGELHKGDVLEVFTKDTDTIDYLIKILNRQKLDIEIKIQQTGNCYQVIIRKL